MFSLGKFSGSTKSVDVFLEALLREPELVLERRSREVLESFDALEGFFRSNFSTDVIFVVDNNDSSINC